jgi:hypothetical protein
MRGGVRSRRPQEDPILGSDWCRGMGKGGGDADGGGGDDGIGSGMVRVRGEGGRMGKSRASFV